MILPRKNDRPIPKFIRERIKVRSGNCCEYVDENGRCSRNTGLSMHHMGHRADGGVNSENNLLHVCGFHRRLLHGEYNRGGKRYKIKEEYQINPDIEVTEYKYEELKE